VEREQRRRREGIRSADWSSAVSRIGNPRGVIAPQRRIFHTFVPRTSPADCQSAIQQVANLRYLSDCRSNRRSVLSRPTKPGQRRRYRVATGAAI
jgi:hypothetical protein